jgi:hypothetical protein
LVEVEDWVKKTTKNGSFANGEDGVVGVLDVDHLLVKNRDVVGIGKFACAEKRMQTEPRGDVEFVCRCSDVDWLFGHLCSWDDVTAG